MKSLSIKTLLFTIIMVGMFFMPSLIKAANEIGIQDSDINIDTIPDNPQPYQDVTIQISSYSTDLTKAMIEWKNGSTTVLAGFGQTSYSFKALGPDTVSIFTITIKPVEGGDPIVKQVVITPSEIDVLWEAVDSYVPPFYRGKAFPSAEGVIRTVAIPNTNTIKQGKGSISYTWTAGENDDVISDASGYNKDAYVFQNNVLNSTEKVSVKASSVDGRYNATDNITIPIVSPKMIFYKRSPTEGVLYNQGVTDEISVPEDQVTVVAAPYYLALKGNEDNFTYNWKINGNDIDTPSAKTELTIHPTAHGGYATIDAVFENAKALFQKVSGELKLDL